MTQKHTAFYPADILLPRIEDYSKWAVVACDQFTSQPEYWQQVQETVGELKSTLNLIYPEAYFFIEGEDKEKRISNINASMQKYLDEDTFECHEQSLIYVERTQSDGSIRHGLVGMVDLEQYEFAPGNTAQIRASEGTVLDRIPPRVAIRKDAPIELPHVMLLIDDPEGTVIEPITQKVNSGSDDSKLAYDFELMQNGGHIKGWVLASAQNDAIEQALQNLNTTEEMEKKYGMKGAAPMLFAVGDGNHSLATAKRCYEIAKENTPKEDWDKLPCRYALVEVVNIHDEALKFEPIHRVIFGCDNEALHNAILNSFADAYELAKGEAAPEGSHVIEYAYDKKQGTIVIPAPKMQLAVGTLQSFLDEYIPQQLKESNDKAWEVDYIHGEDTTVELGSKSGNIGLLVPPMAKSQLFKTVMADGVLPRKTFSMGHAQDKRYYLEARKIK